jgi:hypothetical protein
MLKEWRGVVIQLANLAAIVYLATHATETMAHFALGAVAATNAMAHARARLDSAYGGRWGGGSGGTLLGVLGGEGASVPPSAGPVPGASRVARTLERLAGAASLALSLGALAWLATLELGRVNQGGP